MGRKKDRDHHFRSASRIWHHRWNCLPWRGVHKGVSASITDPDSCPLSAPLNLMSFQRVAWAPLLGSNCVVAIVLHIAASPNRHGEPVSQLLCLPSAVLRKTCRTQTKTLLRESPAGRELG
jgi:hypothetical protein